MAAEREGQEAGGIGPTESGAAYETGAGTSARSAADQPGAQVTPVGTGPGEPAGVPPDQLTGVTPQLAGTRTAATWAAVAAGLFFLIVVLVFILQNLRSVPVHFFWATWSVPLAIDLLLATVLGGLVVFTVGALRILELRRAARQAGGTRPARKGGWRHQGGPVLSGRTSTATGSES